MGSEDPKIHSQDQQKKVDMDGTTIIGGLGPAVVVASGNITAINIGGGAVSGDVYQVLSDNRSDDDQKINRAIDERSDLQPQQKQELIEVANHVLEEVQKGEQANAGKVDYLLHAMGQISPELLGALASHIVEMPAASPECRTVARRALKSIRK
jgi:hypothetical protein